jgi:hypothetical protein
MMLPYYVDHRAGFSGPEFHWYSAGPWLAYQAGKSFWSPSGKTDEAGGGWTTTFVLAGIVGVGVVGYLIYRNLKVSEAAIHGAFGKEEG